MALTSNGLTIKRFRDIVADTQQRLDAANTNIVITDESNKVANNVANTFCLSLSELYEFVEEIYNSFDVLSAEGVALDRLVMFKNLFRLDEEFSTGGVEFSCTGSVSITPSVQVKDDRDRILLANETVTLGTGSFRTFYIPYTATALATAGTKYYIVINSQEFSYTASGGDTFLQVMDAISLAISNDVKYSSTNQAGLLYVANEAFNNVSVILHPDFSISEYSAMVRFRGQEVGDANYPANTITTLVTSLPNVVSINNPENFDQGRLEESDEELRNRFLGTSGAIGRATVDSIIKGVSLVEGVDDVSLINNVEDVVSPDGLPPKSFEVIVQGGEDQDIADTILAYAPAGIESYGTINTSAVDSKGTSHPIAFTRPANVYIFVRVEYEKYEEFNTFPTDGEDQIKQAIVGFGESYQPNQDVIPSSLQVPIYQQVQGVGEMRITCGFSNNPTDTSPSSGYSEDSIEIGVRELALFELSRVTVTNTPLP